MSYCDILWILAFIGGLMGGFLLGLAFGVHVMKKRYRQG